MKLLGTLCKAAMAMLTRMKAVELNCQRNQREMDSRRDVLDFFAATKRDIEAQRMRELAQSLPSGSPTGTRGPSRCSADMTLWNLAGDLPMGRSFSCPTLPPAEHENAVRPKRVPRRQPGALIPTGPPGLQPSIIRRVNNIELNLVRNGAALQKRREMIDEKMAIVRKMEADGTRVKPPEVPSPKPKGNMIERMAEVERNMKVNQEQIEDRREVLDYFSVAKRQAMGKKPDTVIVPEDPAPQFPLPPKSTMIQRLGAVEARSLYNARTLTGQRKKLDEFLGRNPTMYGDGSSGSNSDTQLGESAYRPSPPFPLAQAASMNDRLRSFEQQAMYNAKTLSHQRQFLDEMNLIAQSGKAAAQRLGGE